MNPLIQTSLITLLLAMGLPGIAATNQKAIENRTRVESILAKKGNVETPVIPFKKLTATAISPSDAQSYIINFSLKNNDSQYRLSRAAGIDPITNDIVYVADKNNFGPTQIPAGIYDFIFLGTTEDNESNVMFVAQKYEVTEDSDFTVDFDKCTEVIKFKTLLPDGSEAKEPLYNYDTYTIVEDGNLAFGAWNLFVTMDEQLIDVYSGNFSRGTLDNGWLYDASARNFIKINSGVTNVTLANQTALAGNSDNEGIYYTSVGVSQTVAGTYANNINDYSTIENPLKFRSAESETLTEFNSVSSPEIA